MTDLKTYKSKPHVGKVYDVYMPSVLTMKIILNITEIGKNVKQNIELAITKQIVGKCIAEGFVKPNSIKIINYSSGLVNSENIEFQTVFECMICHPVEGMIIECQAKTITKAGIHSEVVDDNGVMPVTIFIARDHHFTDKQFNNIKENSKLSVRVIGIRYELNDPYICVIGKLVEGNKIVGESDAPKKLTILDDDDDDDE